MPVLLNDDLESLQGNISPWTYSALSIDKLGAMEYTIVNIFVDESGSVSSFASQLEETIKTIVDSCNHSNRSENLLVRLCGFSNGIREIHGYTLLSTIDTSTYKGCLKIGGMTPLYDAFYNAITTVHDYAKTLVLDNDFSVNAITYVITDGEENSSTKATPAKIIDSMDSLNKSELLSSHQIILLGVNDSTCKQSLENYKNQFNIDSYISVGDANVSNMAKLASFISKSISVVSKSVGQSSQQVSQSLNSISF